MTHRAALLPWTRVKQLAEAKAIALLPLGSTEAHGPHLPLNVDVCIAEAVCERVAHALEQEGTSSLVFPPVVYGVTDFAAPFSGTVSVSSEATLNYLSEVLVGIASHGFQRILLVNHHLEPAHFSVVKRAAEKASALCAADIRVVDHRKKPFGPLLGHEFMHGGSHAGRYETSLMMAIAPTLVTEAIRAHLPELAVDLPSAIRSGAKNFNECGGLEAYLGNPAQATAEEGERLLQVLLDCSLSALKT